MMLRSIFLFEIKYHLKYPLLYSMFLTFFLFTFGAEVSDSFQLGGSIGNEFRNSPIVILRWMTIMSIMGVLVVTAFVASSIHRDFSRNTHELFFSRPVSKFDYLMGRFSGSPGSLRLQFIEYLYKILDHRREKHLAPAVRRRIAHQPLDLERYGEFLESKAQDGRSEIHETG